MATMCLSNPLPSSSSSSISTLTSQKPIAKRQLIVCKADNVFSFSKRSLSISIASSLLLSLSGGFEANAAILEADDDLELLEKVKSDRKKRLERQGLVKSSAKEKGYLQDLVYTLSKVGQAIENNDLSAASSVLGKSTDAEWVKKVNSAFNKLTASSDEKVEVDAFNSSLDSLISSVTKSDIEGSKTAFVTLASSFEKWTTLTGLVEELKGL